MDVVTHAMAGVTLAGPFLPAAPLSAGAFILGSVLPDLDALGRLFGKTAFLRLHQTGISATFAGSIELPTGRHVVSVEHSDREGGGSGEPWQWGRNPCQTYTHALPGILAAGLLIVPVPGLLGMPEPWAPLCLLVGMLLHSVLDATNTYGVALLAPFSRRRWSLEWIFFIDAIFIAATLPCATYVCWAATSASERAVPVVSYAYGAFLVAYVGARALLRARALRSCPPGTVSLIPSALVPWRFYGLAVLDESVASFECNALQGTVHHGEKHTTFDHEHREVLSTVEEYALMRSLSRGYYTISAKREGDHLAFRCRDLRTRNFGGRFGALDVTVDQHGEVTAKEFSV